VTGSARVLLGIAAGVVALESIAYIVVAGLDFADASGGRLAFGVGAGILLIAYGLGLAVAAWNIRKARAWARAPIVVAQLIQLLLATDAREGAAWVTPAMAVSALVVLGCLFAPPVTQALSRDRSV
jgi:hypothetical protein